MNVALLPTCLATIAWYHELRPEVKTDRADA